MVPGSITRTPEDLAVSFGEVIGGPTDGETLATFYIDGKFNWTVTKEVAEKIVRAMECFINDEYLEDTNGEIDS